MYSPSIAGLASRIEARAKSDLAEHNVGGASVLVARRDEILYQNHFGAASPNGEAITDQTLFRLASMTKPITAAATMIAVERGLLSLDDPIERYYPAFSAMRVQGREGICEKKIRVWHLLSHTSGIASGNVWADSYSRMTAENMETIESFVDFLSGEPLSFIPEETQEYSAVGAFSVLAGILQKVTDTEYEAFLQKELLLPCRMTDTTFVPSEAQWKRLITMHDKVDGVSCVGKTYDGCVFGKFPPTHYLGGAGLISSMKDYFRFAQMLLSGGVLDGTRILSERSLAEITRPRIPQKAGQAWGLAVRVRTGTENSSLPVGAYGWSGAYGTHFWIDPTNELIGIYLKNSCYDGGSGAKTSKNFEDDVYAQ